MIGYIVFMFFKKYLDITGANIITINIRIILKIKIKGNIDNINFLLLLFLSLTNLLIALGNPKVDKVINKLKVGRTSIYSPIPSVVTDLVKAILITIDSNLVIKPPITSIIVDLINLFFMISPNNIMIFDEKKFLLFKKCDIIM